MSSSLFSIAAHRPLADLLRPTSIDQVVGQDHLLSAGKPIWRMVERRKVSSMILWGPAGVGKTTLASIIAAQSGMAFEKMSAVASGIPELKKVLASASDRRAASGQNTVLFLDEIHHWRSSQQDTLLPFMEDGTIALIGATTENVGFELNGALLSRAPVYRLNRLSPVALDLIIQRAESHLGRHLPVDDDARQLLLELADGDGRYLLNLCEILFEGDDGAFLPPDQMLELVQKKTASYDKAGDAHYAYFSALQKSIRGSDEQAALYWLARMLKGGEPPKAIFRRLSIMATEEIGLADPQAIIHTASCAASFERLGEPEGLPVLGQCVVYLATAVKSNAVYSAFYRAMDLASQTGTLPPPKHLIKASNSAMRDQGYADGYKFDHDYPNAFSGQEFFPDELAGPHRPTLYAPEERANEREIKRRIQWWNSHRGANQTG